MNTIIKYGKRLLWMSLSLIISLLFISLIYYFNIISTNLYNIFLLITILVNMFISSYILGKGADEKGFLEGLKFSIIVITIFIIFTLIINEPLEIKLLIYHLIIIITSVLGSMMGINKKNNSSSS